MDLIFFIQFSKSVLRELRRFRHIAVMLGCAVAFATLVVGALWQETYDVSTTLYADRQNIIKPLLEGKASVTRVEAQRQVVRDTMLSRKVLENIVETKGFLTGDEGAAERAALVSNLRKKVAVRMLGANYIGVTFSDTDPQRSFNVITALVDYFIKESSENKRSESKQAFQFIEKQANQYKDQLRDAEGKLKEFHAANTDGSSALAASKIERLRTNIGDVELDLEQANVRVDSLITQVNQEDKFLSQKAKASSYQARIAAAVADLDTLRLSFTDNHPDVISLVQHIESLRKAAVGEEQVPTSSSFSDVENPVYDELRGQLATAKVSRNSIQKRLGSLKNRLNDALSRSKRIAGKNAELAELTRDYSVTQQLYEDLLESKEKARLSMTLDIEGQGVSYKIQEPAKFPLSPSGLRYIHFVAIGLFLGVFAPLGLVIFYVFIDPRIRWSSNLEQDLGVPLLVDIPRLQSAQTQYIERNQVRNYAFIFCLCVGLYIGVAAILKFSGLS